MNSYTVLIRTYNSETTLPATLEALGRQTNPPSQYVFVDSGSTDRTLACIPEGSVVHKYAGKEFNYSAALNQGLGFVSTEFVLIISSHTKLGLDTAAAYGLSLLSLNPATGGVCFCPENTGQLRHQFIDKNSFDGFNGLFNTCSLVRTVLLKERGFRPEVFTAEDKEWSKWFFETKNGTIARISSAGVIYDNPRGIPLKKRLNEYVAVAYFVNRELLTWMHIKRVAYSAVKLGTQRRWSDRLFYFLLVFRLTACRYFKPVSKSKYF